MHLSKREKAMRRLDDRISELHRIDSAIKLGRLQGELMQMQKDFPSCEKPQPYERTPEYRLQMHLEREYRRLAKAI